MDGRNRNELITSASCLKRSQKKGVQCRRIDTGDLLQEIRQQFSIFFWERAASLNEAIEALGLVASHLSGSESGNGGKKLMFPPRYSQQQFSNNLSDTCSTSTRQTPWR